MKRSQKPSFIRIVSIAPILSYIYDIALRPLPLGVGTTIVVEIFVSAVEIMLVDSFVFVVEGAVVELIIDAVGLFGRLIVCPIETILLCRFCWSLGSLLKALLVGSS